MIELTHIRTSDNLKKKFDAHFIVNGQPKVISFGSSLHSDYTQHKDPLRKNRYILRHRKNEDWTDPLKPGTLSRYILWEYKTLPKAFKEYKKRFNI